MLLLQNISIQKIAMQTINSVLPRLLNISLINNQLIQRRILLSLLLYKSLLNCIRYSNHFTSNKIHPTAEICPETLLHFLITILKILQKEKK